MPEETTLAEIVVPAEPKTKKKPKPKAEKKEKAKPGLRLFQVRTLYALSTVNDPLTVKGIAKRAKIGVRAVSMGLGTVDPKLLKSHDRREGFPSLITLGHVKVVEMEGIVAVQITGSGRKVMKAEMERLGKLPKVQPTG